MNAKTRLLANPAASDGSSAPSKPPEETIFTTPENASFYNRRHYRDLDSSQRHIRLLKIHPRRLQLSEISKAFPDWADRDCDLTRWLKPPPIADPQSVAQPSFDYPLHILSLSDFTMSAWYDSFGGEHRRWIPPNGPSMSFNNPPPGFDYASDNVKSLPSGWSAVIGTTPFSYLEDHKHREWTINQKPETPTHPRYVPKAWYYVNLYTGGATWKFPTERASGAPEEFPDGVICCELLEQIPLTTVTGRYTALSYCAGSSKSTAPIMVDGHLFNAFANLEHAMNCILESKVHDQAPALLWSDQVCINQPNIEEKSHQVGITRQIYELAQHVYVVLSTAQTPKHMHTEAKTGAKAIKVLHNSRPMKVKHEASQVEAEHPMVTTLSDALAIGVEHGLKPTDLQKLLFFVFILIQSEWWSRAWVFQEFIAATRVYVVYGPSTILTWPEIAPWIEGVCTSLPRLLTVWDSELQRRGEDWARSDAQQKIRFEIRERERMEAEELLRRNYVAEKRRHQQARLSSFLGNRLASFFSDTEKQKDEVAVAKPAQPRTEMNPYIALRNTLTSIQAQLDEATKRRDAVLYFLRMKSSWTGLASVPELLQNCHRFSSKDTRDLIYAFIGLADPEHAIKADYSATSSVSNVLIKATERYITAEKCLAVLQWTVLRARQDHGLQLPSWAPDWTYGTYFSPHYREMQQLIDGECVHFRDRADDTPVAEVCWDPSRKIATLAVRGIRVGQLSTIVQDSYDWSRYFRLDSFPQSVVKTTAQALPGDELWILDGASGFYVLRNGLTHFSLIHAAGYYVDAKADIAEQSRSIYLQFIYEQERGILPVQSILLV